MSQADFGYYLECSLDLAVGLANTHDPLSGKNDRLGDAGTLSSFLAEHKVSYARRPSQGDLEQVWGLAARLREAFDARDERSAAKILNEMLQGSNASPELTDHDGEPWHLHFTPEDSSLHQRLTAETSMALAVLISQGEFERLRVCEAESCTDVFVDKSRNRSRLYCSPQICGNRASVAAFRAREKEKALKAGQ